MLSTKWTTNLKFVSSSYVANYVVCLAIFTEDLGGGAFINYTFSRLFSILSNISQANKVINQWVVSNLKCNLILINLYIINLKLTR